jgi:hypothetical protein
MWTWVWTLEEEQNCGWRGSRSRNCSTGDDEISDWTGELESMAAHCSGCSLSGKGWRGDARRRRSSVLPVGSQQRADGPWTRIELNCDGWAGAPKQAESDSYRDGDGQRVNYLIPSQHDEAGLLLPTQPQLKLGITTRLIFLRSLRL